MPLTIFEKISVMPGTVQQLWDFHAHPDAFRRLTPPPIIIQMRENNLKSLTEGTVDFNMWMGPFPIHWVARHEPGPVPASFIDRQLTGPMAYWEHQHIFREVSGGVELTDHITLQHKPGLIGFFTRLMFDGLPLQIFFAYRHWVTRRGMLSIH